MLGPHTHRDNPVSRIMCAPVAPPVTVCKHLKIEKKIGTFLFFREKNCIPHAKMVKRSDKTNTGEGGKGKKGRTVSDDAGGKSLSDTSTSAGVKSTAIRTSVNIFEASKSDKPQYFVDKVKDKRRTKGNNLEFLIGWRGFPDPNHDTWEPLHHLSGSEHMIREFNQQWEKDYVRKTAETLEAQAARRKSAAEQNAQREDIDEAMGEGGGDEEEDGESEDDNEDGHG